MSLFLEVFKVFNLPQALAVVFDFVKESNILLDSGSVADVRVAQMINFLDHANTILGVVPDVVETLPSDIQKLVEDRQSARDQKDFAMADALRAKIRDLGYTVDDTEYGALVKKL